MSCVETLRKLYTTTWSPVGMDSRVFAAKMAGGTTTFTMLCKYMFYDEHSRRDVLTSSFLGGVLAGMGIGFPEISIPAVASALYYTHRREPRHVEPCIDPYDDYSYLYDNSR